MKEMENIFQVFSEMTIVAAYFMSLYIISCVFETILIQLNLKLNFIQVKLYSES